ncbi:hypothetical protein DSUL_50438 [Desulfovibrionales bacterium]
MSVCPAKNEMLTSNQNKIEPDRWTVSCHIQLHHNSMSHLTASLTTISTRLSNSIFVATCMDWTAI